LPEHNFSSLSLLAADFRLIVTRIVEMAVARVPHVKFGRADVLVSRLGLGTMGMSAFYTDSAHTEEESIATIKAAWDSGINFFDTADMYGVGANEELLGRAIRQLKIPREKLFIATKFAIQYDPVTKVFSINCKPEYVKAAIEASLKRLQMDYVDLYYMHRLDPNTPIESTVGALAELVKAGKIRYIGLSEVSAKTLRMACKVHPITALQSEYSLWTLDVEQEILPTCRELGVAFVPYSPLGRGFLTGQLKKFEDLGPNDYRRTSPRFMGDNFQKNLELVAKIEGIAREKGCTASQLALAWLLDKGLDIFPIPGTKRVKYLQDNIGGVEVKLTQQDRDRIAELLLSFPISGHRYNERNATSIDLES